MIDIPFLSFQQKRILEENSEDMQLWGGLDLQDIWHMPDEINKTTINREYSRVISIINEIRHSPVDYSTFKPSYDFKGRNAQIIADFTSPDKIMGRCPCPKDGEQTRCCNLKTLDAVQQCQFACSYCSIQSFYSHNQIRIVSDLKQKLDGIVLEPDTWHIGTGQSSDSLALGNDYGTLDALVNFAKKHPDVIIELKTKSARTDFLELDMPANIVSTWSVNAATVTENEEHLAASLNGRISAAAKVSASGHPVGFHIHPMVYFTHWKEEYARLVEKLCDSIDPDNVVMTSIGTLTFTKQNLRALRESKRPTRVTQMPLDIIAGKYSYDIETKKRMFSYVYSLFPKEWKEKVFFYLCMEDPSLWMPCLGREYSCNADFEADMKKHYFDKINSIISKN